MNPFENSPRLVSRGSQRREHCPLPSRSSFHGRYPCAAANDHHPTCPDTGMSTLATNGATATTREYKPVPNNRLASTTDSSGYVFPAIWNFPPFFTQQPNPQTYAHQLSLWTSLFLSWTQFHRVFRIDADSTDGVAACAELFWNKAINRRLPIPAIRELVNHLLKLGHLAPDPPRQSSTFLIYWRKPDEWAQVVYHWVNESGLTGSIMTFYEITEGDMAHTTELHLLPHPMLRKALESLVKQGKAQIFKGEETGEGVKFF